MAKEVKINLRLSMRVREVLNDEAEVEDTRIGTVANRLLQEELGRMIAVGADRCVMKDTKEYRALIPHRPTGSMKTSFCSMRLTVYDWIGQPTV